MLAMRGTYCVGTVMAVDRDVDYQCDLDALSAQSPLADFFARRGAMSEFVTGTIPYDAEETVSDLRLNWHQAANLYYPANKLPKLKLLKDHGVAAIDTDFSVLILVGGESYQKRLTEIQAWLERGDYRYKVYGRYRTLRVDYETRKEPVGLVFVFRKTSDAMIFAYTFGS